MENANLKKIYSWVLFGTCLSALGPSTFKKMLIITKMNQELSIAYFLFFGAISVLAMYPINSSIKLRKMKVSFNRTEICKLICCGLLVALQFWSFTTGMNKGTVTETTLAVRISPSIAVIFGSLYLGEKIKNWRNFLFGSIFCLSGFFLMQKMDSLKMLNAPSLIWGAISALALAGKNTLSSSLVKKHHKVPNIIVVFSGMIIGGLTMIILINKDSFILPSINQIMVLFFLGFGTVAIPALINNYAFKKTDNMGAVTFFSFLLPLFGAVTAYFVLEEKDFDYIRIGISFLFISFGIWLINNKL